MVPPRAPRPCACSPEAGEPPRGTPGRADRGEPPPSAIHPALLPGCRRFLRVSLEPAVPGMGASGRSRFLRRGVRAAVPRGRALPGGGILGTPGAGFWCGGAERGVEEGRAEQLEAVVKEKGAAIWTRRWGASGPSAASIERNPQMGRRPSLDLSSGFTWKVVYGRDPIN